MRHVSAYSHWRDVHVVIALRPNNFPLRLCPRYFVSCGGALSTGCDYVPHSSFGCVPPLDTSPLASGGRPPQALTLFGGVGFIARRLRRPEKGNADGVRGIFGTACRVGLRPCDRTHRPCATFVRWWGVG